MPLKIRPASETQLDLLSAGECMIRLSPAGHGRIEYATNLEVWVGGGEYNVAYALARLGLRTGWSSRLVDNPLGKLVLNHARAVGMDTREVIMVPYDGVGKKDRIGLNFTEVGTGVRGSVTMYDRGHSAASHLKPGEVDWKRIFKDRGVRWLHTGGIFTALSDETAATCKEMLQAAHDAGTIVSYDLNFRSKLWSSKRAQEVTRELVPLVDCLIGNEEDFQKVLGFEVEGTDENLRSLPVENYKKMVKKVVEAYPNIQVVGTTLREVVSGLVNNWSAILYAEGDFFLSRRYEGLEIEDRVGGGDGFSSGFAYGFLSGMTPQECVDLGAAHGALLQSTRGDTSMITLEELMHVFKGGSARIKR
ncbi:MAG: 2-dehydro-3-deoxygluconokinase [Candidatus Hinthialibacteria bacterium]|nr:sugar kinase [bacterium]MBK7494542.1 sugar kinase [Candidatus Omnitrophota bacterium]MBV6483394.1 2-dehydro-3-deoxygluconokinase [bacterium]MCK6495680.1 sugar kinase [bacterium]NUP94336.1 sugar kinase [Candidatus Omnitrophota bacterium]